VHDELLIWYSGLTSLTRGSKSFRQKKNENRLFVVWLFVTCVCVFKCGVITVTCICVFKCGVRRVTTCESIIYYGIFRISGFLVTSMKEAETTIHGAIDLSNYSRIRMKNFERSFPERLGFSSGCPRSFCSLLAFKNNLRTPRIIL
jgi:hypothetical protein